MNHQTDIHSVKNRYYAEGLVVIENDENPGYYHFKCIFCSKWIYYINGTGKWLNWDSKKECIKKALYNHFLNKTSNIKHVKLKNNPKDRHVDKQREFQIMTNLGRAALYNIIEYGTDRKYERDIARLYQFRVDIGDRLHRRAALNVFKQILYEIVKYIFTQF